MRVIYLMYIVISTRPEESAPHCAYPPVWREPAQGALKGPIAHLEGKELLKRKGESLVLILVLLAVLAMVGCGSPTTKVSADEVVQNALAAQAGVTSSSTTVNFDLSWQGSKSGANVEGGIKVVGTLDMAPASKKMHAKVGTDIRMPPINLQPSIDAYVVDNCTYLQVGLGGTDRGWAKEPLDSSFWDNLTISQFEPQVLQVMDPEYLRKETLNGQSCYVLKLTPNMEQLQGMLAQQAGSGQQAPELDQLIKSMSITAWVAEETNLLIKMEIDSEMSLPPAVLAEIASDSSLSIQLPGGTSIPLLPQVDSDLKVTLKITVEFSNFNQAPPIELPAAAKATTMSFNQYLGVLMASFFLGS